MLPRELRWLKGHLVWQSSGPWPKVPEHRRRGHLCGRCRHPEAGLSFLGLGAQLLTPSRNNMIHTAQSATDYQQMRLLWIPAGVLIALAVFSTNVIGDGRRDPLDPVRHTGCG